MLSSAHRLSRQTGRPPRARPYDRGVGDEHIRQLRHVVSSAKIALYGHAAKTNLRADVREGGLRPGHRQHLRAI